MTFFYHFWYQPHYHLRRSHMGIYWHPWELVKGSKKGRKVLENKGFSLFWACSSAVRAGDS